MRLVCTTACLLWLTSLALLADSISGYDTEPSGYRQTQNATNRLVFVARIDDDNSTLYCVATKDSRRVLVAVSLNVTGKTRHRFCSLNCSYVSQWCAAA
ncbi:hypothetical protein NP493_266g01025 [Ridgeia piscesae]|uniref:Uncharacterized protein n=1 Tax=Ridgeia piscesae TaxID=27915 RepID=A0AAD9NXQ1_RIDPI|nr:hypothetical protein NP493_266g01025 [Ridgeia piscesae]